MKRFIPILGLFLLLLSAVPSLSAGPSPLGNPLSNGDIQNIVEQQSPEWIYPSNAYNVWQCTHDGTLEDFENGGGTEHPDTCVHNPYVNDSCIWDVDDHVGLSDFGFLNAGNSATYTRCNVSDSFNNFGGDNKTFDAQIFAPTKNIVVTYTDTLGRTVTPTPVANGSGWRWTVCVLDDNNGPFVEIPSSNGGQGLRVDGTITITATKKTNSISVFYSVWGWLREFSSLTHCPNPYQPGG